MAASTCKFSSSKTSTRAAQGHQHVSAANEVRTTAGMGGITTAMPMVAEQPPASSLLLYSTGRPCTLPTPGAAPRKPAGQAPISKYTTVVPSPGSTSSATPHLRGTPV